MGDDHVAITAFRYRQGRDGIGWLTPARAIWGAAAALACVPVNAVHPLQIISVTVEDRGATGTEPVPSSQEDDIGAGSYAAGTGSLSGGRFARLSRSWPSSTAKSASLSQASWIERGISTQPLPRISRARR